MSNIIVVTAIVYVQSAQLTLFVLKKKNNEKKKTLSTIHLIKHRGGGDTD